MYMYTLFGSPHHTVWFLAHCNIQIISTQPSSLCYLTETLERINGLRSSSVVEYWFLVSICLAYINQTVFHLSRVVRKPAFCICENKDADQLRGNREANQRLCFRYIDSTIPLLSKSKILSLWPSSVAVQPGLCGTWSEIPKTGFLTTRLIFRWNITLAYPYS